MNPIIVALILELIFKLVTLFLDRNKDLTVGEIKVMHGTLDLIDSVTPYMTQRQHRKHDSKIKKIRKLVG